MSAAAATQASQYHEGTATKDLTVEILKSIRDGVQSTNSRLDQTNERLEQMREELSRRIVESEVQTATALADVAGSLRDMTTLLRTLVDLKPRVERCESDIDLLKRRLPEGPH